MTPLITDPPRGNCNCKINPFAHPILTKLFLLTQLFNFKYVSGKCCTTGGQSRIMLGTWETVHIKFDLPGSTYYKFNLQITELLRQDDFPGRTGHIWALLLYLGDNP